MRLQGESRELTVTLTPEELEDLSADLAAAVRYADQEEHHLEGRKAAWREELKGLKEDLHAARSEASKLAETVRTGRERRDVNCTWKHALEAGWRFLVRDDTGERVASVKLKDDERQMVIGEPSYAEPTPEELAEWLKTLPVNEEQALPEGHAEEVTPEDRAVDLLLDPDADESFGPSSDELTGEEQTRAYEQEMWEANAEEGDICGVTMDHDVNPATNECRRCGAELLDDGPFEAGEDDDDPALDTEEDMLEQAIDDAIVTDEYGESLEEPISARSTTPASSRMGK